MKRLNNINAIIAISILFVASITSCSDDFYEADMGGRITPDQHYTSLDDVEKSYEGCFALIQDVAQNQIILDGLRSDLMDVTEQATPDMININNHNFNVSNTFIDLSNYYKIVVNVNEILPNLEQVLKLDRDFDSLEMRRYTQQLVTLRSWAYFNLARLNNEVNFLDESDPTRAPVNMSKKDAISELISQLVPFIDDEDVLRSDYKDGDLIFVRNEIDLYVLLGEMYLEINEYGKAIENLKFAVDGPAFSPRDEMYMVTNLYERDAWPSIFTQSVYQTKTVISAIAYSFEHKQNNNLEKWFVNEYRIKPSSSIVSAFENENSKGSEEGDVYRGNGWSYYSYVDANEDVVNFITKYSIDQDLQLSSDIILYRAADVHLMLAEALNRNGESDKALILINDGFKSVSGADRGDYTTWSGNLGIRGRAYLRPVNASSVADIEDLIIEERMKELAFEGKRWFDLVRIAERRDNEAYLADKVAAKFSGTMASEIRSKLMNKENWYLPLPQ